MLRFLGAAMVAGALLVGSESPAEAFCRTTTVGIPANYNPHVNGCFTEGLYLFWRNQCTSYSINEGASRVVPFAAATSIIDAAFARWPAVQCEGGGHPGITATNIGPAVCTEVTYNEKTPNQNLIVFRDDFWPYTDSSNTLGLTTVTFAALTGEIFDADMEINSSLKNLSITDQVPKDGYDLASVVTHEAGHFFGLAHATDINATMYAAYKPGTTALRTLSQDDIDGICAIYPDNTQRIVSPTVSPTGAVPADACNDVPRNGFTQECVAPTEDSGGCAVAPIAHPPSPLGLGSFGAAGVGIALVVARRRRRA